MQPYDKYDEVEFDVPVGKNGDCCEYFYIRPQAANEKTTDICVECRSSESRCESSARCALCHLCLEHHSSVVPEQDADRRRQGR